MTLFLKATNSNWYTEFIRPAAEAVLSVKPHQYILDIGTGPGNLPLMLIAAEPTLNITGIDVDTTMIDKARKRSANGRVNFLYQKMDAALEFGDSQFDVVSFCSVLFLLNDNSKTLLMNEALRVLKPGGSIIILTPSGSKARFTAFSEVSRFKPLKHNLTYLFWKVLTTGGGRRWQKGEWLPDFAKDNRLDYKTIRTFNDNALLETITLNNNP